MLVEIEQFVNWVRRRNTQARTWRDYGYDLKQFVEVVGDKPPAQVTLYDVDRFVNHQASQGMSAVTINRRLAAVMSFFAFVGDEEPGVVCPVLPKRHKLKSESYRLPPASSRLRGTAPPQSKSENPHHRHNAGEPQPEWYPELDEDHWFRQAQPPLPRFRAMINTHLKNYFHRLDRWGKVGYNVGYCGVKWSEVG